jgi:hypothetical protein
MYILDLSTYLVFYLETTCGSSIDLPSMLTPMTPTPTTHLKPLYIPGSDKYKICVQTTNLVFLLHFLVAFAQTHPASQPPQPWPLLAEMAP